MDIPLGKLLIALRGDEPLREAAKRIGISHTYLAVLEDGIDKRSGKPLQPTEETLQKLSRGYNYSLSKLKEIAGYPALQVDLIDLLENKETQITAGGRPLTPEERVKILLAINMTEDDTEKKKVIDISDIKLSAANKEGEEVRVEPSPQLKAILEKVMNEVLDKREKEKKR